MTSELNFKPAHELAALIRAKQLSPVELLQACLDRIEETNPTLNAWVGQRPEVAMQEARDLEARIAKGEVVGPLAGLPFGVKELDDLEGFATTHGSRPYKDNFPERDSVEVERLRAAGAIALGKTTAPEFGYTAFTKNLLTGITRNPWNPERTPGGSSGGSAAAVSSGQLPFATGSDGGGSIRIPCCWTGLYGMKVSQGRIPIAPRDMLPWIDTAVHGPMVRTVRDAAMYIDVTNGTHEADPTSLPKNPFNYADVLDQLPKKLRIAWSPTLGYATVEPDVARETENAAKAFEQMGHSVELVEAPISDTGSMWSVIGSAETYAYIYDKIEDHRDDFGRSFLSGTETATRVTWDRYGRAQRRRAKLVQEIWHLFEKYDLLLTPTLPVEAIDARGGWPQYIAGKPVENPLHVVAFTYPFNLSGHPAASVRAGFSDNGLPVGLQIVGPRHRDDLVLQASYAYEQARPWNDKWPVKVTQFAG